jgi:hypothetical protein
LPYFVKKTHFLFGYFVKKAHFLFGYFVKKAHFCLTFFPLQKSLQIIFKQLKSTWKKKAPFSLNILLQKMIGKSSLNDFEVGRRNYSICCSVVLKRRTLVKYERNERKGKNTSGTSEAGFQ